MQVECIYAPLVAKTYCVEALNKMKKKVENLIRLYDFL